MKIAFSEKLVIPFLSSNLSRSIHRAAVPVYGATDRCNVKRWLIGRVTEITGNGHYEEGNRYGRFKI